MSLAIYTVNKKRKCGCGVVARPLSLFVHNLDVLYVHTPAKEWINRVRFPILLVVSGTEKNDISLSAFARENLASRDGFDSPVPRQPAQSHT